MNKGPALTITDEALKKLVADHVLSALPPEKIEALAAEAVKARVQTLTPEEAAAKLQCANVRQCRDFCRDQRIPIIHGTAKKWWVALADVDDWILKHRVVLPSNDAPTGTRIASVTGRRAA